MSKWDLFLKTIGAIPVKPLVENAEQTGRIFDKHMEKRSRKDYSMEVKMNENNRLLGVENWSVFKGVNLDTSKIPIIATIGPTVYDPQRGIDMLKQLVDAGVSVFRINFSHVSPQGEMSKGNNGEIRIKKYSHENIRKVISRIREIEGEEEVPVPIPIMMDLKGPEIRVKEVYEKGSKVEDGIFSVNSGDIIHIWQESRRSEPPIDNSVKLVIITFEGSFIQDAHPGNLIRIDEGRVELRIKGRNHNIVVTEVETEGNILRGKSVNLPEGRIVSIEEAITKKDREDLKKCFDVDVVAQSFVRQAEDVGDLKGALTSYYADESSCGLKYPVPKIIAKIETKEAVDDFLNILENNNTFGVMIARGDLGGELGIARVPSIQEKLLDVANRVGKPAIVATQMLESMRESPVPTRAEAEDV